MKMHGGVGVLLLLFHAASVHGQTVPADSARAPYPLCPPVAVAGGVLLTEGGDTLRQPDVLIRAAVRARELRFAARPVTHVRATGVPEGHAVRTLARENLPAPIVPGETYRNVHVAVEIRACLEVRDLMNVGGWR
jgi:hypothetical protein